MATAFRAAALCCALACSSTGGGKSRASDAAQTTADTTAGAGLVCDPAGECTDAATGLVWRLGPDEIERAQLDAYCTDLATTHDDWRLPTLTEAVALKRTDGLASCMPACTDKGVGCTCRVEGETAGVDTFIVGINGVFEIVTSTRTADGERWVVSPEITALESMTNPPLQPLCVRP